MYYLCAMATVSYGSGQKYVYPIIHHKRLKTGTCLFSIFSNIPVLCVKTRQILSSSSISYICFKSPHLFLSNRLVSFSCIFPPRQLFRLFHDYQCHLIIGCRVAVNSGSRKILFLQTKSSFRVGVSKEKKTITVKYGY